MKHSELSPQSTQNHESWLGAALSLVAILLSAPPMSAAADLKPETLQQWNKYVKAGDARNQEHLLPGSQFLSSDAIPGQIPRLQSGEIVVVPAGPHIPAKVPKGLIHDWTGAAFIPNVTFEGILPILRSYDHYKEFYHPNVADSRLIAASGLSDQFAMVLINKSLISKTALDTEYRTTYTRVDDRRWYSVAETTRVQEIAGYNTPSQHMLPEDQGSGLIWRLHTITRFEERDGGIYIEMEAIALSRDIPTALRWVVDPIVRRVSRSSLTTSLEQTEAAVRLHTSEVGVVTAERRLCGYGRICPPSAGAAINSFR